MKKTFLYTLAAVASFSLAGCNEDFEDWASPQSNPQNEAAAKYGVNVSAGLQANVVMDEATPENVQLLLLEAENSDIASIAIKSFTINGASIEYGYAGNAISVSSATLDSLVEATTFDRSATEHSLDINVDFAAVLNTGEAVSLSGGTTGSLTPYANTPEKDSKGYALLGQWQGWDSSNPTWMTEVEPGVYQATVTTMEETNWFKFYEGSGFDAVNFAWDDVALGCEINGDDSSPNLLVWNGDPRFEALQTPVITGIGNWLVTLDMNKFYYKFEPVETYYYVVGDANGWSAEDKCCMFYAHGSNVYSYTTKWTNQWSLKIWDEDNFGNWDTAFGSVADGSTDATGILTNSDAGAFGPNADGGYYTLTIDMGAKTYSWEAVTPSAEYSSVSLIGDFNSWGDDIDMTQLAGAPHNWYVRAAIPSDGGLKFRADHDWVTSWGTDDATAIGDVYYLAPGAGNITVPAGTYDFYLNDITGRWNIVRVD